MPLIKFYINKELCNNESTETNAHKSIERYYMRLLMINKFQITSEDKLVLDTKVNLKKEIKESSQNEVSHILQ